MECVADVYEVDKQTLVAAKEKAGVEVVLLNLPKRKYRNSEPQRVVLGVT